MKVEEIENEVGLAKGLRIISYAVDDRGKYIGASNAGSEPVNVANGLAWKEVRRNIQEVGDKVRSGRLSPLAYYMAIHLMDPGLLAGYVDMAKWRVRLHLTPFFFKRLGDGVMEKYAALFRVSIHELRSGELPQPNYPENIMDLTK